MNLLMLGGGNCQYNAIKKAKSMGHTVIVSDYFSDCIGKKYCDFEELVSTFDISKNIKVAKKYNIDGIMTLGTDQPVYTAAAVSEKLGLPFPINLKTALAVTNKKEMKNIFIKNNIPTIKYAFIKKDFSDSDLMHLSFPVVTKPLDSQGQRGVLLLNNIQEIRENIDNILSFSKKEEILVEEYYDSDEITVNGWVINGILYILTVVDRVRQFNPPHLGICIAHNFPSRHLNNYYTQIFSISNDIIKAFNINNGPIYFQFLIGSEGLKVNEIACRIGGAYEDHTIPIISGIDILDLQFNTVFGEPIDDSKIKKYSLKENNLFLSTQLFFAKPGFLKYMTPKQEIESLKGVHKIHYNFREGHKIGNITDATERAGFIIIGGSSWEDMMLNIDATFKKMQLLDEKGNNLIIPYSSYKNKYKYV